MPKNKSTRSVNPAFPDILAAALCLAGAAFCLVCFWFDLNSSLQRQNEKPLGLVSRKENTASRRFADSSLWDRLREDSPVYSGDYIRTEEKSAADLAFASGGVIGLAENSLIQIFAEDESPGVRLSGGALNVSADAGAEIIVSSGENRVLVRPGAAVNVRGGDGDEALGVSVEKGSALISARDGSREALSGEAFSLSSGLTESAETFSVSALSAALAAPLAFTPAEGSVIRYQGETPSPRFRWNVPEASGAAPSRYILEAADNPAFTNPALSVETRNNGLAAALPAAGLWYWRVTAVYAPGGETRASQAVSFRAEEGNPDAPPAFSLPPQDNSLRAVFPPDGYTAAAELLPDMRFTWRSPEGEARFQLSRSGDFSAPELDEAVSGRVWRPHRLESGTWYWRVVSGNETTPARIFDAALPLAAPLPGLNNAGGVPLNAAGQGLFEWQAVTGADHYEFRLYEGQGGGNLLHAETVTGTSLALPLAAYADGVYRWTVQAFAEQSADSTRREGRAGEYIFELGETENAQPAVPVPPVRRTSEPRPAAPPAPPPAQTPEALRPLTAPRLVSPGNNLLFDAERLRGVNGISFTWTPVAGAESYRFGLFDAGGKEIAAAAPTAASFTLSDLSVLSNGQFRWQVSAVRRGGREQGPAAEYRFTVNIPNLQRSTLEDIGTIYGQ